MAEGLVSMVLEQLASLAFKQIEEEVSLVVGVDNLILHFNAIQGVLQDAEERQLTEANVRNWVANLEDLSYQINDLLDEWNTEILKHQMMIEDSKGDDFVHTKWTSKVRFLIPSARICFGKVGQLVMRRDIATRIREINERLTLIANLRQSYKFQEIKRGTERPERSITSSFVQISNIIGREEEKEDTMSMLFGESSNTSSAQQEGRNVISIVGMGGLGKTAFAQSIYEDERVKAYFNPRIWVCVSDPFNQVKIAKAIVEVIKTDGQINSDNLQPYLQCISDEIRGKKFLLVLDDVWTPTMDKWEPIKKALETSDICSRILVTTRKETAGVMMEATNKHTVKLDKLRKKDSLELFKGIAFSEQIGDESRFFDLGIMNKIVEKCDGLPLAIKTLASIMRYKKTKEEWLDVLGSKMWELEEVAQQVFQSLLLSYYELTPSVRRCLLYCAMFPKDYDFEKVELIQFWMYQGYLGRDKEKDTITGQTYFDNLVMQSFFQDFIKDENGNIEHCKMHDIVHDFVLFIVKNECVFMEADRDSESNVVLDNKVHHLNIRHSSFDLFADSIYNCKRLRTLLASDISTLSSDLILQWKCLRTLQLSNNNLKELPEEIGKLVHLRHLNLNYSQLLEELPDTVGNLYNLQTLSLASCTSLKKLPVTMRKLINLKHLFVDRSYVLKLPKEIGRLYSLQTLDGDVIPSNANNKQLKLGDLRNLNQLRGHLSIRLLKSEKDVGDAEAAQLVNKKYLSRLSLKFGQEDEANNRDEEILNSFQPHENLESLRIVGYGGTTLCPHWMMSLSHLKELSVFSFPFCELLAHLGKLPSLENLEVGKMNRLQKLGVEFLGKESPMEISFPKLKRLGFESMQEWEEWVGVEGERESDVSQLVTTIMPSLSRLEIVQCPRLKSLPDFLWKTALRELFIDGCPNILQDCETGSGAEWDKVSRIPNITMNGKNVRTGQLSLIGPEIKRKVIIHELEEGGKTSAELRQLLNDYRKVKKRRGFWRGRPSKQAPNMETIVASLVRPLQNRSLNTTTNNEPPSQVAAEAAAQAAPKESAAEG